jgi:hypothetical protein
MKLRASLLSIALIPMLLFSTSGFAQTGRIDAGTTIQVRTTEHIKVSDSDERVFHGVVDQDVVNSNKRIVIPRGSDVELVVNEVGDDDLALDLQSITVRGQTYSVESQSSVIGDERKEGIGVNKRTGKYVGGGAIIGAIIGGIAGGGKGAAIGAGVGAAGGAGAQVLTRGSKVEVPAETLLTFTLQQPLMTTAALRSQQQRYPDVYNSSAAFRSGVLAGQADAERGLSRNLQNRKWTSSQDRADYQAGYNQGYSGDTTVHSTSGNRISIGSDNYVTWNAPAGSRVFMSVDGGRERLFARNASGSQYASSLDSGHMYTFVLRDSRGVELARDTVDLR